MNLVYNMLHVAYHMVITFFTSYIYIYAFPYTLTALLFPSRNFLQSRSGPTDMAVSSDTALTSIAQYKAQHSPKQGTALPSIAHYQGKHSPMQG